MDILYVSHKRRSVPRLIQYVPTAKRQIALSMTLTFFVRPQIFDVPYSLTIQEQRNPTRDIFVLISELYEAALSQPPQPLKSLQTDSLVTTASFRELVLQRSSNSQNDFLALLVLSAARSSFYSFND